MARRARLVRQALTESLLLAVAGSLPGRKTNPKLEIGICGEHSSVQFCYRVGSAFSAWRANPSRRFAGKSGFLECVSS